ncbi:guanine-1-methyltransferase-domain-containing protein [Aspergillus ambiguus]|uniref:tRNA (guanine(9)-N(1))-methyltransferase n=1 Tax=Aspergillus ambiguus TaxID=176160 RepID=UPI003CCCDDEE
MEEEERPRKFPKLDHDGAQDDSEPTMTGAVGSVPEDTNATTKQTTEEPEASTTINDEAQAPGEEGAEGAPKMSKRQLKKLERQKKWEANRADRKVKRKEKLAEKKERRRNEIAQAREEGGEEAVEKLLKSWARTPQRFAQSKQLPLTLILDCGYDDLMLEKERISLSSQLTRAYSENAKSQYRTHMVLSSFNKKLKERFDTVMVKQYENWKGVRVMNEDFAQAAEQAKEWMQGPGGGELAGPFAEQTEAKPEDGEVVYLSSDSQNTLTELKPYSTYIIGGLVDKNRHKGVCHKHAVEKGIKTAKLPIGEYIEMNHRSVLATNHVVEIMLRWIELGDWGEAFMKVLPPRKGGMLKGAKEESEEPSQGEA